MEGDHALAFYNVIIRIPELERTPPERRAIMYWLVNPGRQRGGPSPSQA